MTDRRRSTTGKGRSGRKSDRSAARKRKGKEAAEREEALRVSVVIPALNEERTIGPTVRNAVEALRSNDVTGEVIVVDNGSTDATSRIATDEGARVVREDRRGYGSAYLRGFGEAKGEVIFTGDADGTYDFGDLPRFLEKVDQGADFVMGSRFRGTLMPGSMPFHRRIGNRLLSGFMTLLFHPGVSDGHCGMRMLTRKGLEKLPLSTTGMEFATEMILLAKRARLPTAEVPIVYGARPEGSYSKLSSARDGLRHVRYMLSEASPVAFWAPAAVFVVAGVSLLVVSGGSGGAALAGLALLVGAAIGGEAWFGPRLYGRYALREGQTPPRWVGPLKSGARVLGPAALAAWAVMGILTVAGVAALGGWVVAALVIGILAVGLAISMTGVPTAPRGAVVGAGPREREGAERPEAPRRTAAVTAFLGRHWPFLVVLVGGIVLRVLVSVAYRPALMFVGDSYAYLRNAAKLDPGPVRPFLYSLFLIPFQKADAVDVVPAVQHLMGVGIGIGIYALLRRLGVGRWAGTLGAAPILLDAFELNVEHFILSETLFTAFLVGALLLLVWPERPSIAACAGAGLLIGGATLTRVVGLVLIVPLVGYLLGKRFGLLRSGVTVAAFALPVILYASWFQSVTGTFGVSQYDGYFLYGRVAPFADCDRAGIPESQRFLCDPRPPEERPFPNFYIWNAESPIHEFPEDMSIEEKNQILGSFSRKVIFSQPVDYASVVARDTVHFFVPGRFTGAQDQPVSTWQFGIRMPIRERVWLSIPPCLANPYPGCRKDVALCFNRGPQCFTLLSDYQPVRPLADSLRSYQRFGYTQGPLLALALILGLVGAWGLPGAARRRLRAESVLLVVTGVALLVSAVMTVLFDYRYLLPALAVLPPAGAVGWTVLAARLRARRPRRDVGAGREGPVAEERSLELVGSGESRADGGKQAP